MYCPIFKSVNTLSIHLDKPPLKLLKVPNPLSLLLSSKMDTKLFLFCFFVVTKAEFSPELQAAIDFCGGITDLTDGNCPPNEVPVDTSSLDRSLKNAKNVKVCQTE